VHVQQRLAARLLEGHGGDRPAITPFFVGPDQAGVRRYLEVPTEELHGRALVAEHQAVPAPDTRIDLAGRVARVPTGPTETRLARINRGDLYWAEGEYTRLRAEYPGITARGRRRLRRFVGPWARGRG
jgi:hypothetical protein